MIGCRKFVLCLPLWADVPSVTAFVRGTVLGGVIMETLMSAIGRTSPPSVTPLLTQREMMIVFLMAAGHTASEIAALLELRPRTVENRKRIIYEKLGVGNQSHAVAKAIALGLLQPGPPPTLPRRGPVPQRHAGEPGRALLAALLGPASNSRDEIGQLLISERVPLLFAMKREE